MVQRKTSCTARVQTHIYWRILNARRSLTAKQTVNFDTVNFKTVNFKTVNFKTVNLKNGKLKQKGYKRNDPYKKR